jgi:hypothetical protein
MPRGCLEGLGAIRHHLGGVCVGLRGQFEDHDAEDFARTTAAAVGEMRYTDFESCYVYMFSASIGMRLPLAPLALHGR